MASVFIDHNKERGIQAHVSDGLTPPRGIEFNSREPTAHVDPLTGLELLNALAKCSSDDNRSGQLSGSASEDARYCQLFDDSDT